VKLLTIQAVRKQQTQERPAHHTHLSGQMNACERCYSDTGDVHRSTWELCAWQQLERVLEQPIVQHFMAQHDLVRQSTHLLGRDLGFLVEAKVLGGKRGAADVYVPVLDLIIQIDGQHHDGVDQLLVDSRFDIDARQQGRRLLRLHYADADKFYDYIHSAVVLCLQSMTSSWVMYTKHHPHHPTQVGQAAGVTTYHHVTTEN
jgi:hypothetical protein